MTTATITITGLTWDEKRIAGTDDVRGVASATFTTRWEGDVEGESTCGLLIDYLDGDAADPHSLVGPYVGYEHVTGRIGEREGSFVLAVRGEHSAAAARTEVEVVPGSGTGGLVGLSGRGSYAATAMEYTMELDYTLG